MARYAAVVVLERSDSFHSSVWIVGLDGWKARIHTSQTEGRQRIAVPNLTEPVVFGLGWVVTAQIDDLTTQLHEELASSEQNCQGSQRGQSPGKRGNQKTPSFLRVVLQDVIQAMAEKSVDGQQYNNGTSQGGTTDVGLHTGCTLRSIFFPLVASLVWWLLDHHGEGDDQTFLKYLVGYFVYYLQQVGDTVTEFNTRLFDRVIVIIRTIEEYVHRIRDEEFNVAVVNVAVVNVAHQYHTMMMDLRPNSKTEQLKVGSFSEICKTLRPPEMPPIPEWKSATTDRRKRLEQARAAAKVNGNMEVVSLTSLEYNGIIQNSYLQIATLNEFFWKAADELFDLHVSYDIADLRLRLDLLSKHVNLADAESRTTPHIMTVRFRSEVVAIWVSFCWAFRTAEDSVSNPTLVWICP